MVQTLTKYLKWAIGIAIVVAGVQFSFVYVNRTQLKSIMSSEALDARRANTSEEEVIERIYQRAAATNVKIPDDAEIEVYGLDDPEEDVVVKLDYVDIVNLFVAEVPMEMSVTARADAPDNY